MTKTSYKSKLHLAKFFTPTKFIASGLIIVLLGTIGEIVKAQPSVKPPATQSQPTSTKKAIAEQLLGNWQVKDPNTGQIISLIFGSEGKLFLILPAPSGSPAAIPMKYKINPNTQPMQIDLSVSPNETGATIFDINADGKLRLELEGIEPNQKRPSAFTAKAVLFDKISDSMKVPDNIQVIDIEPEPAKPRQNIAIQYITILNKAQQDYYRKNKRFAANLEELGIISSAETELYRYRILPQKDRTVSAAITAQAKEAGYPSYIGAVFASKINGETTTVSGICETEKSSTTPPAMAKGPASGTAQIRCSAGSRLLK